MKALRKLAPGSGNLGLRDVPRPEPGSDQVVIKVDSVGICGTDLHIQQDEFPTEPPVTLGHEVAGVISEVGSAVTGWHVGDRVTTETYFHVCGECRHCRRGRPNLCALRRSIGSKEDGAMAEYLLTPNRNLHLVPDGLDLEAATFTEPLACVVHGLVDTAGVRAGDRVALAGPGPIGLLALQVCLAAGAQVVVLGTARDRLRLDLAAQLGAVAVLEVEELTDPAGTVADLIGPPDLVVECSGAGPAAAMLLQIAGKGARFCQLGLAGKPVTLDLDLVCYKELVITGSNATVPTAWPRALRLLASGLVDTGRLVTHRFGLDEWETAFAVAQAKDGVKVMFRPNPPASSA